MLADCPLITSNTVTDIAMIYILDGLHCNYFFIPATSHWGRR